MNTGDILFPENAIVEIQLADLPQSAKRPRLCIKEVVVAELSNEKMKAGYSRFSLPEPGYDRVRYCLVYRYSRGTGENEYFYSYLQFHYRVSPNERSNFNRNTKKLYSDNVGEHQNFINSVAKGESPKIHKVIKKILKENNG
jgi:hypothetical protein